MCRIFLLSSAPPKKVSCDLGCALLVTVNSVPGCAIAATAVAAVDIADHIADHIAFSEE